MKGSGRYAGGPRRPLAVTAAVVGAVVTAVVALTVVGVVVGTSRTARHDGTAVRPSASAPQTSVVTPPLVPPPTSAARPTVRIVKDHLTFSRQRTADTAAYAKRHYGRASAALDAQLIVLHYSDSDTYASVRSLFAANQPNNGEPPGTCAHYVVDKDGTVHELVPPTVMCRHTIGLNHVAIGIEFVQSSGGRDPRWAVQQVLARQQQLEAGLALVRMLQGEYGIPDDKVIGHAMANDAKEFRDLEGWRNDHVDWQAQEVARFRALLTRP